MMSESMARNGPWLSAFQEPWLFCRLFSLRNDLLLSGKSLHAVRHSDIDCQADDGSSTNMRERTQILRLCAIMGRESLFKEFRVFHGNVKRSFRKRSMHTKQKLSALWVFAHFQDML